MLTMYIHELKQYRNITIVWIVSLISVASLYISLYPSMAPQMDALKKVLESYPKALMAALNVDISTFATFAGLYSLVITWVMLATSIQAMNLGTGIVAKEENRNTAEFLLAKPVNRVQILSMKLLAALTVLVVTNLCFMAGVWLEISFMPSVTIAGKTFLLMTLPLFFVQLFFLGLGFIVSVTAPKIRSVLSISLATVFAFYIVSIFDNIIGSEAARYLTPFKFFDNKYIITNGSYEWVYLGLEAACLVVFLAAAYFFYLKRDIRTT